MSKDTSIGELVRRAESDFISGTGTLTSKYVTSDLYEDINKIYAYLESKHITGKYDSKGRAKPFFNIVVGARNIWYRATDIDRANIQVTPESKSQVVPAFVATQLLQEWMKKEAFGTFLNKWGMDLASFNSSVVKFVESEGKLHPMVVPWSRLIVDQVNFEDNPKIEILELTEAQLYQRKGYDKDMVERLCEALQARETIGHDKKDLKSNYIKLYEVHGNFPLSYLTGKEADEDTYQQQMHVISFVESKQTGKFDDFTLYSGREAQDPYMLTCLLPNTDGSISLDGAVKQLFEAQWMLNHTRKSIKDQIDLASKLIFQTADRNYAGKNALRAIETGDILVHEVNQPLTQVNNTSHDITAQESEANTWKSLSNEIVGVSESMLGNVAPSGTAWRQVEALLNESHSLFELMTENKGLDVIRMLTTFVIPFIKKGLDTSDEITAVLQAHDIKKIDAMYTPKEAVRRHKLEAKKALLSGELPAPYDPAVHESQVQQELAKDGAQRFFVPSDIDNSTWKDVVKDLEWKLNIDITGESENKQSVLTTLNTALSVVANPNYSNSPQAQLIVSKILMATGTVSPIEIASLPTTPNMQPQAPLPQPPVTTTPAP